MLARSPEILIFSGRVYNDVDFTEIWGRYLLDWGWNYNGLMALRRSRCSSSAPKNGEPEQWILHATPRNRRLSNSKLALPYIDLFISFSRLICPSVCPLLYGSESAASTADLSRPRPIAKVSKPFTPHEREASNHPSNSLAFRERTILENFWTSG